MLCFRFLLIIKTKIMIRDFKTKNTDSRLLIQKTIFGIGFNIDFVTATFDRPRIVTVYFDLIFIRFWWNLYKRA